ncbi:protein BatD [Shewanella sp. KX20019]|uniref:BatD family protein n=1 Tax=Shewanella sp. KX20019 TaxID=2803864 RepID=UPI0019253415|nr:BatD family protein [Shewanella sp. KX20019]QQX78775.1 protein BatD [Shewanella sp. KX20019]
MVIRHRLITLFFVALTAAAPANAITSLQASVDRNPIIEGESLVLTVIADDDLNSGELNTSSLLKNFIVGRTSISRSKQIMNFDARNETRWQVLLSPKSIGNITIPAFNIKGVSSAAINLSVVDRDSQPQKKQDIFMRSSLSTEEAYVGQMLTYRVKLYLALELQRGVLSAPVLDGAQIKQLGEDKDSNEIVNGKRYRVIERAYAIIADQPGELTINGASFSGDVLVPAKRNGGMFSFNESRPTQTQAPKSVVLINPEPVEYQGQWLVSDLVVLKEDWPTTQVEYKIGDPITRTISLLASNADETSLPDIRLSTPAELKSYPEKAQRKSFVRDKQMVSQLTQTTAIVATKAGTYTLPQINIPWWNPHLKQQQYATLPARTVVVTGSAIAEPMGINLPLKAVTTTSAGYWPWLTAGFASLWLLTLLLWLNGRKKLTVSPAKNDYKTTATIKSNSRKVVEQSCAAQDPTKVINATRAYYSERYGRPMTLQDIANTSAELASAIASLQQSAYSKSYTDIDYKRLLSVILSINVNSKQSNTSALDSLNPQI